MQTTKYIGTGRRHTRTDEELKILKGAIFSTGAFLKSRRFLIFMFLSLILFFVSVNAGVLVPCYNVYYGEKFVGTVSKIKNLDKKFLAYPAVATAGKITDEEVFKENIMLCDEKFERAAALKINGEIIFTAENEQIILASIYNYIKSFGYDINEEMHFADGVEIKSGIYEKKHHVSGSDAVLLIERINPVVMQNGSQIIPIPEDEEVFLLPVSAPVSSPFGPRWGREHKGIDFAANYGDDVFAAYDGTVKFSGYESGFGNLLIIEHPNGYESYYAHLSERIAADGEKVTKGQVIGKVGSTGNSTGPHLHFEIRKDNTAQNPAEFIGIR